MGIVLLMLICISLAMIGLILYRLYIQNQVQSIQLSSNASKEFRKKLDFIKDKEQAKHVRSIFVSCLLFSVAFLAVGYKVSQFDSRIEQLEKKNLRLKDNLKLLKKQQAELINKMAVIPYPEDGLSLKAIDWDAQLTRKERHAVEIELTQKLGPYLGFNKVIPVLNQKKATLDLTLEGEVIGENSDRVKANLTLFTNEIADGSELLQVNVNMNSIKNQLHQSAYRCRYSRNNANESFRLVSDKN